MKKEVAEKLIEALESGKYQQGKGVLRNDKDGFCCLGVLCDISGLGEWILPNEDENHLDYIVESEKGYGSLPEKVVSWAEMKSSFGIFEESKNLKQSLANLNDSGLSFAEIAEIIRKHWKEL